MVFLIVGQNKRLQAIQNLTAYFDTGCSGLGGGFRRAAAQAADRETLAAPVAAGGHRFDSSAAAQAVGPMSSEPLILQDRKQLRRHCGTKRKRLCASGLIFLR